MRQILLYIFLMFVCSVSAEQFRITGKVVDAFNEPMIGGTVEVVGASCGTATDIDGNFSIFVEKGQILKFSYVGYHSKEVEVMNDSSLFIELEEIPLEEMTPEDIEKLSITTTGITNQRRPDFLKTGNVARPIERDSTKTNPKNQHSVINH